jgi:hypothetical protein
VNGQLSLQTDDQELPPTQPKLSLQYSSRRGLEVNVKKYEIE